MLKIRFSRWWKKWDPYFNIVVAEHSSPIQWKFIEKVWWFFSRRKKDTLKFSSERIEYWMSVWAKPSDSVSRLLKSQGMESADKYIEQRVMKPKKEASAPTEEKS